MIIRVSEIRQLCCGSREDEDSLNGGGIGGAGGIK